MKRTNGFFLSAFWLFSIMTACSGVDEPDTQVMDASVRIDAGDMQPYMLIGTGEIGFEPLSENQTLPLVLGPQGTGRLRGYHMWGAIRTRGLNASERISLNFGLTRVSDDRVIASSQWDKKLQPSVDGDEFYALTVIVSDCCEARGQMLNLNVTATDKDSRTVTDTIQILAGESCADVEGREICP